jgi:DNA-damage-inducible protein J
MSGTIRARTDPTLKAKVDQILEELGLNASDTIRLLYKQIALRKGLPFPVEIPNATTRRAMKDVREGKGLTGYGDTAELFDKLGR